VGAAGVVKVTEVGTCAVAGDVAEDDPPEFETVITTWMYLPASALTGV
jgi:hypothetical protein